MNRVIARKWLKQARHDLEFAEANIGIHGYDVACFLAHQAVEKLLKAIFAVEGRQVPRSHYIDELAQSLNLSDEILVHVNGLTSDYMMARYPDVTDEVPYEQYNEAVAREKVRAAKKVFELLRDRYSELPD